MYKIDDYIEINQKSYDIVADEYKAKYKNNSGASEFYKILTDFVVSRKKENNFKMLEIGPGVGTLLKIFEQNGFRTTAVELSEKMSLLATESSPDTVMINGNINEIDFISNQFDFILAMAVIHNFPEEDLIKLLNRVKKWLKDDGYFILDTTNNKITEDGFFKKEDYNSKVVRYRRKWNKKDLDKFLMSQEFVVDENIIYKDETSNKEWLIYSLKK